LLDSLLQEMVATSFSILGRACCTRLGQLQASRSCASLAFVPQHKETQSEDIEKLSEFLEPVERLLVITGAGISTESGIPDYRSEGVGLYATSVKRPIQHKVFMDSKQARQSYWARNFVGWPRWSSFQPNIAHRTLARWEESGKLSCLVTQNVDQLHYKAGSRKVVELHGTNSTVTCMNCSFTQPRLQLQRVLEELNPSMVAKTDIIRPDGDVELTAEEVSQFKVPDCPKCGTGILKPNVVFFGDNVPTDRVAAVRREVARSDAMLVVGSSLFVYSGYRFVTQAKDLGIPIAVINIGQTRADKIVDLKLEAKAGDVLPRVL